MAAPAPTSAPWSSSEEADFLAAHVVATTPDGGAAAYADLDRADVVLLAGFEPEEESPIVFLRLRKAVRRHKTRVHALAPFATRGLTKLDGTLILAAPGTETEVLAAQSAADALARTSAVILVGERLAATAVARAPKRVRGPTSRSAGASPTSPRTRHWTPRPSSRVRPRATSRRS